MDVGDDETIWHPVERDGAMHSRIHTASGSLPDYGLAKVLDSSEEMNIGLVSWVAVSVSCDRFHRMPIFQTWHNMQSVVEERSVDDVSGPVILRSQSRCQNVGRGWITVTPS